ncbi:hypothetical protein A3K69_04415 [Candidatus Bathyarchaeota archaeon RBG_16_57_9]|nr:MAG: hypothetical protein A3K69_04415 [Candidatus Bathyarchaeota archaeon RBG_16_57_9]
MRPPSPPGRSLREDFETALAVMERRRGAEALTTGSGPLDSLVGGVEPGGFYLFYGPGGEDELDRLVHRMVFEAVRADPCREAVYVLCGNYRRSRTMVDLDYLLSLFTGTGLDVDQCLSRVHMVYAFSERQLIRVPALVEGVLGDAGDVTLVAVQQIAKLFHGADAVRFEDPAEFTGVVSGLKQLCCERGAALAATCRPAGRGLVPPPEGGAYLRHAATVIVYMRPLRDGRVSAHLVKHPESALTGRRISYLEEEYAWGG